MGRQQAEQAGVSDLLKAVEDGLLRIHTFEAMGGVDAKIEDRTESMIHEYLDVLGQALSDVSTYPLFDDRSGDLVRAALAEGKISVSEPGVARGRHSALAARLLERLPSFEGATMDEVIDIRRHLERPLVRFRSAMIKFSDQIKVAAWDEDFTPEAQKVFLRDIEPSILEIEEAIKSNKILVALARGTAGKPFDFVAKSALGVGLSQVHFLSHTVMTGIATTVAGASIVTDIYKDWRDKQNALEHNQMFFYYQAGRLLER